MLALLASSSMKVAGRKGRLFVSDGKYSETEREFRWIATDSEVNSFKNGHFVIEGAIEMKDYPEMAPMKGTDVIVGLLKSRSEEHTSELQSRPHLVCRLLLEKKKYTVLSRPARW